MSWSLRLLIGLLVLVLVGLQYRLWVGEGSLAEITSLQRKIDQQQKELAQLQTRNQALRREVEALRDGLAAVEARAREELGMIKEGETFYQVIESDSPAPRQ